MKAFYDFALSPDFCLPLLLLMGTLGICERILKYKLALENNDFSKTEENLLFILLIKKCAAPGALALAAWTFMMLRSVV